MNSEDVKIILSEVYDTVLSSLDLDPKQERGKRLVCLALDNKILERLRTVRDALNAQLPKDMIGDLADLTQTFDGNTRELPLCALFTETHRGWMLSFNQITGARYHKSYGKQIAVGLTLKRNPEVLLMESKRDRFYGYWDKTVARYGTDNGEEPIVTEGMSYRVNKTMLADDRFRAFTAKFFDTAGAIERKYILRDIGRCIKESGFFLPSVPYSVVEQAHTPAELLDYCSRKPADLKLNFNRMNINAAYAASVLSGTVSPRDLSLVAEMSPETLRKCVTPKAIFDGLLSRRSQEEFITNYCLNSGDVYDVMNDYAVTDYISLCLDEQEPVRLGLSVNGMKKAHDRLMETVRERERHAAELEGTIVPENSDFDDLEMTLDIFFKGEFRRMRTAAELFNEGEEQHNCVFTRKYLIKADRAAVFHWDHQDGSYTVQIAIDNEGMYYVEEVRGKFNGECPPEARSRLDGAVTAANVTEWK